jgi:hypothetical protein
VLFDTRKLQIVDKKTAAEMNADAQHEKLLSL